MFVRIHSVGEGSQEWSFDISLQEHIHSPVKASWLWTLWHSWGIPRGPRLVKSHAPLQDVGLTVLSWGMGALAHFVFWSPRPNSSGSHCDNSIHVCSVPWALPPPCYFHSLFPPTATFLVFGRVHYAVFICTYAATSIHLLHLSVSFPFLLPCLLIPPHSPYKHSWSIFSIILGLGFTEKREHPAFGLFEFGLSHSAQSPVQFPCRWHNFIFIYDWVIFPGVNVLTRVSVCVNGWMDR
jgi:hypothetical protein